LFIGGEKRTAVVVSIMGRLQKPKNTGDRGSARRRCHLIDKSACQTGFAIRARRKG
jgi:hypothetical protein